MTYESETQRERASSDVKNLKTGTVAVNRLKTKLSYTNGSALLDKTVKSQQMIKT